MAFFQQKKDYALPGRFTGVPKLSLERRCLVCGRVISSGSAVFECCPDCYQLLGIRKGGYCPQCGHIYTSQQEAPYACTECRENPKPWHGFGFYQAYAGLLRNIFLVYKFQQGLGYSRLLQNFLLQAYLYHLYPYEPDLIVPVPIPSRRLFWRGFNQSLELSRTLGKHLRIQVNPDVLRRTAYTPAQAGLNRKQRLQNLQGKIKADNKRIKAKRILLVDDIYTTGATLAICTKALQKAGAEKVQVLVLARSI